MEKVFEIRIRKTDTLTKEQQDDVQIQLKRLGYSGYIGYSRISYAVDKDKSSRDNPVLKIIKIEPIEGTIIDEHNKIMDLIDDSVF